MALVTFNENIDHYVKGDVVDLDKAEQKRVDAYATEHGIEKPYQKGAKDVSNVSETPNLQTQAAEASLAKGVVETGNDKTDGDDRDLKGGVENQDELVENANKQAMGETLPGQEGDNPSEIKDSETVNDEDAADESDQDDESESDDDQGSDEGESDSASDDSQDEGDAEDKADEGTTTDDVAETDEAAELENDNDSPAEGTPAPETTTPNSQGSGATTPAKTQANKARNTNK